MAKIDTAKLVAELERLPYAGRWRRLVEIGRRSKIHPATATLIEELGSSSKAYHRLLAVQTACGSGDGARVAAALADPSRTVRRAGARLIVHLCDDRQALAALEAIVHRGLLRKGVKSLARRGRTGPIDAFLAPRLATDSPQPHLVDLLPWGSAALAERFLPQLEAFGTDHSWRLFPRRHPELVKDWLRERILRGSEIDERWKSRIEDGLAALATPLPDDALELVRLYLQRSVAPRDVRSALSGLVASRPAEIFDLLRTLHDQDRLHSPRGIFGGVLFAKVAHRLGAERLSLLVRHAPQSLGEDRQGGDLYRRLSASEREVLITAFLEQERGDWGAILFRHCRRDGHLGLVRQQAFERWSRAARNRYGVIPLQRLEVLPRDLREQEARRHLDSCPFLDEPKERLAYARLLSFDGAREELKVYLGHPEGDVRSWALATLLGTLRRDRSALADGLALVATRQFEQDPVRRAMLGALAELPAGRFGREHLPSVDAILQAALDAADLSSATAAAAESWLFRLFSLDLDWSCRWLVRLLEIRGQISASGLGAALTLAEAARLAPALAGLIVGWRRRERSGVLIQLATSLGDRLAVVPTLLEALETLARELPLAHVAARALDLLKEHDFRRFDRLVAELLATDRSFAMVKSVADHVSRKRQDLLPPLLDGKPFAGRFATGKTSWILIFESGCSRFTAVQQQAYAAGLLRLLADPALAVPDMRSAVHALVRLAFADAAPILALALDPRPPLREMAIRGLPWLDAGEGVPVLLEALDDSRARWAIYALRKAFGEMAPPSVLTALRATPLAKVTVAKEVIRLLGELGGSEGYEELLRLDRPDLHRDARIALLRALWHHLEEARTWAIFDRAVADPDWVVAVKVADMPFDRLSEDAEPRALELLARILGRPEPEARVDLLKRAPALRLRDPERVLFRRLLACMDADSLSERKFAFEAVLQRMKAEEAQQVANKLIEMRPRWQVLEALLQKLGSQFHVLGRDRLCRLGEIVAAALEGDPLATPLFLRLAARVEEPAGLAAAFQRLAARDLLGYDAMSAALEAVRGCRRPATLEKELRSQTDWRLRRLGIEALVQASGPRRGWSEERLALLELYRADPAPGVAGPAAFIFPPG